jgi:micrococcal nuclease
VTLKAVVRIVATFTVAGTLLVVPGRSSARHAAPHGLRGMVVLDGKEISVTWIDGDTFRPPGTRHGARIVGYNTLETYGDVHRWGTWKPAALHALANQATVVAASRVRTCGSLGRPDRYGRDLVSCPDAARALVGEGLAMVYAMEKDVPDPTLLALQATAQTDRRGIWAEGVPDIIVTSVHSADEEGGGYNRVVDTRTGQAVGRKHGRVFRECEEVCETGGDARSCLVYVPFERRYGGEKAACLR